jgi:hypothetical protein
MVESFKREMPSILMSIYIEDKLQLCISFKMGRECTQFKNLHATSMHLEWKHDCTFSYMSIGWWESKFIYSKDP